MQTSIFINIHSNIAQCFHYLKMTIAGYIQRVDLGHLVYITGGASSPSLAYQYGPHTVYTNCTLVLPRELYRWCPESFLWLINKGRIQEANKILKSMAWMNRGQYREDMLDEVAQQCRKNQNTVHDTKSTEENKHHITTVCMCHILLSN